MTTAMQELISELDVISKDSSSTFKRGLKLAADIAFNKLVNEKQQIISAYKREGFPPKDNKSLDDSAKQYYKNTYLKP